MKIAINDCFGGFGVTKAVFKELGIEYDGYGYLDNDSFGIKSSNYNEYRKHPKLISAIEKIGVEDSSGSCAKICIVDIPEDVEWEINDYDGAESIHEVHRSW